MEIVVNLTVISFNSGQVPVAKFQERLKVTVSPPTRQSLSDEDHHRVSASVMKAAAQVKRRWQAQHLDRVALEEQQVAEEGETYGSGGLVITGQAGHTLEVEPPPPPPPPNIFFDRLFSKPLLTEGFTNRVCVCMEVFELVPRQIRFALNSGSD